MSLTNPVLDVRNLTVRTSFGAAIVDDVNLRVQRGETIAIVGESGSGKSVTARAITGLLTQGLDASGEIRIGGKSYDNASERQWRLARGSEITWLPQDPFTMLSPLRRIKNSISDGAGKPIKSSELEQRLHEVGISDSAVLAKFPFQLSGGLRQRVGIAAALSSDPRILVADEPTTALDVTSQRKVLSLLAHIQETRGLALVLITHDLPVALSVADRIYVMYAGTIVESFAPSDLTLGAPLHPYTRALLEANPPADRKVAQLSTVPGSVPPPMERRDECVFRARCEFAIQECADSKPPLIKVGDRQTACIRTLDLTISEGSISTTLSPTGSNAEIVLSVTDIRKRFGHHTALGGVSLEVRRGQIVGIVGESGSGKTTLARIIAGLETCDSGSVDMPQGMKGNGRAKPVQIVFQDPSGTLNPAHSVGSILRDALAAGNQESDRKHVTALLDRVGLPGSFADRNASSLSGGQRQRVAVARGLAPRSKVLLCDEPTSALDVMVQAQILNLLREIRDELDLAMVFVTHDLGVARQMTDYIYVLRQGLCVEHGPTERIFESPEHDYTRELLQSLPAHSGH